VEKTMPLSFEGYNSGWHTDFMYAGKIFKLRRHFKSCPKENNEDNERKKEEHIEKSSGAERRERGVDG
jgi:hypothetical protein